MRRKVMLKPEYPKKCIVELAHHKQKHSWDCGISCILMVLPQDLRQQLERNINYVFKDENLNKSIWTIDLCYILSRLGIRHIFYTITMGVHPGYKKNSFYKRVLNNDEKRVNTRFLNATNSGINIKIGSLQLATLLEHLIYGPVIVLTNAKLLCCEHCCRKVAVKFRRCLPWPPPYQGHFIVLCGYDTNTRQVFYRNPSLDNRVCVMSVECFEKARKSYGTDQDLIFVYL